MKQVLKIIALCAGLVTFIAAAALAIVCIKEIIDYIGTVKTRIGKRLTGCDAE